MTKDKFGLTQEDYAEQAQRRRALEFRDNMGRVVNSRKGYTMTRKTALIISGLVFLAMAITLAMLGQAKADGYVSGPTGNYTFGNFMAFGPAKIINVEPKVSVEADARDAQGGRECNFTFDMDQLGVKHYNFSKSPKGCEFGYLPGEVR
jgi:hypothetical protein